MKRIKIRRKDINREPKHGSLYARLQLPTEPRLVQLCTDVLTQKQPSYVRTARIADLEVDRPEMLPRVRSVVAEEPSLKLKMFTDPEYRWVVYRNARGRLVMFDDYLAYAVARAIGFTEIRVQVCGEVRPDIER